MPTKRTPHTQAAETPEVIQMAPQPASIAAAQVESEFTPRVWNSITQLEPELRADLENLLHQGQTFDLETKFDPKLFMEGLKRVLEALDRAGYRLELRLCHVQLPSPERVVSCKGTNRCNGDGDEEIS